MILQHAAPRGCSDLPVAPVTVDVAAPRGSIMQRVDALALGVLARDMGAGRATKTDVIDPAVGLIVHRKAGDPGRALCPGGPLCQGGPGHAQTLQEAGRPHVGVRACGS